MRNATSAPRGGEEVAEVNSVRVSRVGDGFGNVNANVADIFAMIVIKEDAEGVQLLQRLEVKCWLGSSAARELAGVDVGLSARLAEGGDGGGRSLLAIRMIQPIRQSGRD